MEKLVIGNMKMNILSGLERDRYCKAFEKRIDPTRLSDVQLVLCPPCVHLESFIRILGKKVKWGAQNIFWERAGSYTGEISPSMIRNAGADYVILGHSERRRYFCEKDEEIGLKLIAALKVGLIPVLCVGEDQEERLRMSLAVVKQLERCLANVNRAKIENIVIAYEPVWAISSMNPRHLPTSDDIMSARLIIKKFLVKKYGPKTAGKVRIIYGGSVSALNAREVCLDSGMDGVLVGKESLVPNEFIKIAEIIGE